jgi:hypothetical protein
VTHKGFTNQKTVNMVLMHKGNIIGTQDTAFGDNQGV